MKCNTRTMVTMGVALVAILAIAYAIFPPVRAFVLGIGPFLLILICPLSMWLMMKGMNDQGGNTVRRQNRRQSGKSRF
ncbi:DUF2933 domain-containing protein, partial [Ralstonia mannitolilytica]